MPYRGYRAVIVLAGVALASFAPGCATLPLAPAESTGCRAVPAKAEADQQTVPAPETLAGDFKPSGGWFDHPRWHEAYERLQCDLTFCGEDYRHYYSLETLTGLAVGFGIAAPIANTSADQDIRHWYQRRVRTNTTDEFADAVNYPGQYWIAVPIALEMAALMGKLPDDYDTDGGFYEWSHRTVRTMVVGVPPMLAMYAVVGSSRPDRDDSRWHPFQDLHGVSGHTFMGAVPFLTAAMMTDEPWLQAPLVAGSFLTGWARINNDRHYFSQAILGWWMAYWACRSVDQTQCERKSYLISPTISPDCTGVAVQFRY
jgi:hypothetical protein